jgi:hypothetical protein
MQCNLAEQAFHPEIEMSRISRRNVKE